MKKNFLKRLFNHHKKDVGINVDGDDYLHELFNDPSDLKFVLYDSMQSDMNLKECCKSKDGTCATIECQHNYRRYGGEIYDIIKETN